LRPLPCLVISSVPQPLTPSTPPASSATSR
jgi:hypothetical protein